MGNCAEAILPPRLDNLHPFVKPITEHAFACLHRLFVLRCVLQSVGRATSAAGHQSDVCVTVARLAADTQAGKALLDEQSWDFTRLLNCAFEFPGTSPPNAHRAAFDLATETLVLLPRGAPADAVGLSNKECQALCQLVEQEALKRSELLATAQKRPPRKR